MFLIFLIWLDWHFMCTYFDFNWNFYLVIKLKKVNNQKFHTGCSYIWTEQDTCLDLTIFFATFQYCSWCAGFVDQTLYWSMVIRYRLFQWTPWQKTLCSRPLSGTVWRIFKISLYWFIFWFKGKVYS